MSTQPMLFSPAPWVESRDGSVTGRSLFRRHYSHRPYADGRRPRLFVGPGRKLVLLTPCARALFVWRKYTSDDGQQGINCAVFRNEGAGLSSSLIHEAERLVDELWGRQRHFTYVNPAKLHTARKRGHEYCPWPPGRCFLEAGWQFIGWTKRRHLAILSREVLV